jgi:hypothetical protein
MQNDHHSSSSRRAALLVLTSVMSMAGCSTGANFLSRQMDPPAIRIVTTDAGASADVVPVAQELTTQSTSTSHKSAWCEYLSEDAAAQATIMRSPTLSGSLDDGAKAGLSVGLNLSSFTKAELIERSAEIKCRRYMAEMGLQKLAFVAPQSLTSAGYRAKSQSISGRKSEMASIRKLITQELQSGNMTKDKASSLLVMLDQISADAATARSQADRRMSDKIGSSKGADVYGRELLIADGELEDVNNQMRTVDAMDLSVSAGWNESDLKDGINSFDDSFNGKVSFSVKLGALAPKRFAHEERAKLARARAIQSEEGGTLWQISVLRDAHQRAVVGLVDAQAKISQAITETEQYIKVVRSVSNPEFAGPLIAARLQVIKLKAERAAVDGSIAELKANMKALSTG